MEFFLGGFFFLACPVFTKFNNAIIDYNIDGLTASVGTGIVTLYVVYYLVRNTTNSQFSVTMALYSLTVLMCC